jgi:hypothetical protein
MKSTKTKKFIASVISDVSTVLAKTSSCKCLYLLAKEAKMPESLYKKD